MKTLVPLVLACLTVQAGQYVALDTTGYTVACGQIHSWLYTNSGYQVPVLPGGTGGLLDTFEFIAMEDTNGTPCNLRVHLVGHENLDTIRTSGVMPSETAPFIHRVFSAEAGGLEIHRAVDLHQSCETNFTRIVLHFNGTPIRPGLWWVLFFEDDCKRRWSIPPLAMPEGTNAPAAWFAARYWTGTRWLLYFQPLLVQSRNQTVPYKIVMREQEIPKVDTTNANAFRLFIDTAFDGTRFYSQVTTSNAMAPMKYTLQCQDETTWREMSWQDCDSRTAQTNGPLTLWDTTTKPGMIYRVKEERP